MKKPTKPKKQIKPKAKNDSIKKQLMIQALTKSLGIVSSACQAVNISRNCHYEWMKSDPEYKAQVEDIANVELDFVVSKLHKRINDGSDPAIIYYLKCKGKSRGYSEGEQLPTQLPEIKVNVISNRRPE